MEQFNGKRIDNIPLLSLVKDYNRQLIIGGKNLLCMQMFPIQFLMFSKCHFIVLVVKDQAKGGTTYHHFGISSFIEEIGCAA
jgi:hypothetical protein